MKLLRKSLLMTLAAAGIGIGTMGSAHADAFASAILDINNFRLLHSGGAAFSTADFTTLTGTNDAHATASLNGVFANGAQSFPILSGSNPDVPHQCVGVPCPALPENDFTPFPGPPPVPGTFGYADQALTGSSIIIGATPAGAHAQTRADASLPVNGIASGNSDVGTSTTFAFTLGTGDTMTVAFDAIPYTQAYVSAGAAPTTNANARLSWSMQIIDLSSGTSVFDFAPTALNSLSNVSRTDGLPGTSTYNGALASLAFASTTPFLTGGTAYQITVQHNTLANTLVAVPEPATLAVFGIGLLGLALVSRRRKQS
ncbi:MAG: EDSAP-1 family PEP-CTERM protein [Pseudomonadota bacterium]